MTRPLPHEIAERAVGGGGSRVAIVTVESGVNLRWASSTLTTNGAATTTNTTVIAIEGVADGQAFGTRSGTVLGLAEIDDLLEAAVAIAGSSTAAEDAAALPESQVSLDWDAAAIETSSQDFGALTEKLGELFRAGQGDGIEHFGYAEFSNTTCYLATSNGTRLRFALPAARFEMTAKSHNRSRSTWVGQGGRSFDAIDVGAAEAMLRRQLAWQANTVELTPGRHPALLTPSAVSDLFIDLLWSAIAREAHDGNSVFSKAGGGTRVGERLTTVPITMFSDPDDPDLGCAPFLVAPGSSVVTSVFDNGLPLHRTEWISNGTLAALLTTRHTAGLTGLANTPFVDNATLVHADGHGSLEDVIARTEDGVLLNSLWYIREVDPQRMLLTGLTRDGAYQVRDGEVVGAVSNFRFNDSPVEMLARVTDAGSAVRTLPRELGDYFPRVAMPPLLVSDFNFSTVSQAS
jgi:predicted Zn-dependent protease